MKENELKALISLIDDPDKNIFNQVEEQLVGIGPLAIPLLKSFRETTLDSITQTRIEIIIKTIQLEQLQNEIQLWMIHKPDDLLEGLLIINRYQYPNIDESKIHFEIAEIRRKIWLELMYEMSPNEKVKLLNNFIFKEFGLGGNIANYHDPQNSFISTVLETKKGNPISLAFIYSIIAQQLEIPIYGVNLPKHFIVAYMEETEQNPLFYINVFNRGQIMKADDVYSFLKQLNIPLQEKYTLPCTNVDIVKRIFRNLMNAYENLGKIDKKNEINSFLRLLEENSVN